MALIKADRVRESSTTTGTGAFTLSGAEATFRTFASVCATGDTVYYTIAHRTANEWEAGFGTYSALNTFTRTAVHSSSNSGNLVTFSAGTKEVFLTLPARHLDRINDNGQSTAIGSKTSVVAVNDSATLPDLDLQFSELKTLTAKYGPTPSYSRASTGRYTNSSGVLTSAAVNEPRFDHVLENGVWVSKGLLIEEQRTNTFQYSHDFSNAYWNKYQSAASTNSTLSPDGSSLAWLFTENTANDAHALRRQIAGFSTGTYTLSCYAKAGTRSWINLNLSETGIADRRTWFNLSNGTIGTSAAGNTATITNVGNGWYRCTASRLVSVTSPIFDVELAPSDAVAVYVGDGSSGAYFWGAQLESGPFATSYVPSLSNSSTSRSADVCQITGSAFTNLWNASEGTISLEQDFLSYSDPAADQRYFSIAASGNNPAFILNYDNGTSFFWYRYFSGLDQLVLPDVNSAFKVSLAFKTNDYATVLNGGTPVTSSTKTLPTTFERIDIGYQVGSAARSSWVQRLRYFRSRLDNTQLVNLSGGINTLAFKPVTGSGSVTVANEYSGINISVPNPLPITNGGTGGTTAVSGAVNLIKSAPNDGAEYTLKSKQISGSPSFYWVDSTGYAPTLDLLFAADKTLTPYSGPTPSYSRASTGTFFNSSGVLSSAANSAPRFNHTYNGTSWVSRGLLVEEQRTNLILQSQDANNASWSKLDVTTSANNSAFVDGNVTAALMTASILNTGRHQIYQAITAGAGIYTFSSFVKKTNNRYIAVGIHDNISSRYSVVVDLDTGLATTTLTSGSPANTSNSIVNCGSGWYRVSVTMTNAGTGVSGNVGLSNSATPANSFAMPSFFNSGTESMLLGGMQLEVGSFPTSYIPTTTAAVTRSADVCQISGADFSSFWNASEGSFALEADSIGFASTGSNRFFYAAQSGGVAFYSLDIDPTLGLEYRVVNSSLQAQLTHTQPNAGVLFKHSLSYKVNDFASSLNGSAVATDTSGTLPTATSLGVGYFPGFNQHGNCHIARLRYYPVRLPNATLQVLST